MWFQHDEAPPHFRPEGHEYSNTAHFIIGELGRTVSFLGVHTLRLRVFLKFYLKQSQCCGACDYLWVHQARLHANDTNGDNFE